jgi:TonB-linked SusC/RagA family outer membrane protein
MDNKLIAARQRQRLLYCLLLLLFALGVRPDRLLAQGGAAGTGSVTGVVRNDQGEPLLWVSVVATDSKTHLSAGTQTDSMGIFRFAKLPAGDKYSFTFTGVGYQPQTLSGYSIKANSAIDVLVKLKDINNAMSEVVVVGYGTQRRADVTGAVSQISGEVLENRSIPNVSQGLEGTVAGLNLIMGDGKPIQSPTFNIRGTTSIGQGGGTSLVLIDGIEGDPSLINPNDIATVTVLKDASSSAIYGARAAFGVILITTKTPKKGRATLNYSSNYSIKMPTTVPKIVSNGYQYALGFDSAWTAWNNYSQTPSSINKTQVFSQAWLNEYAIVNANPGMSKTQVVNGNYVYYGNTDWYKVLYKNNLGAIDQNLSMSGGSEKATYYIAGRYYGQDGLFRYNSDNYHLYNLTAKGSIDLTDWFTMTDALYFNSRYYHNPENVGEGGDIWRNMADEAHPSSMLLNPDGTLTYSAAYTVGDFYYGKNGLDLNDNSLKNTAAFNAHLMHNKLQIKGDFTFEQVDSNVKETQVPVPYEAGPGQALQYVGSSTNDIRENYNTTTYIATNVYGQYETRFNDDHYFKVLAGYNYEQSTFNALNAERNGLVYSSATNINLAEGTNVTTSGGYNKWAILGGFGRLNYSFKDRYLIELDGRYDGSSKFPSNQRYAFFPSGSAGWRVSKEAFWHVDPKSVSDLKIRGSYGSLGNGSISSYLYQENFNINESNFIINGVRPQETGDPQVLPSGLTWETVTTADLGLDAGFLSNRLTFSGDIWDRKTTNMFTVGKTLPAVFGATVAYGNYANMDTKGWEATVAWHDEFRVAHKALHYNVSFWMSDYLSKITQYDNVTKSLTDWYTGEHVGEIWGYVNDGYWTNANYTQAKAFQPIFQSSSPYVWLPGDLKYKDIHQMGVINNGNNTATNPGDMKIIGNSTPRYAFGFRLGGDWNNFFVNTFFQGIGEEKWWPGTQDDEFWGQYNRPYEYLLKYQVGKIWEPNNPNAYFPRYRGYVAQNGSTGELVNPQTKYLQNVAYIRLKNLQIGYSLPASVIQKTGFTAARFYVTAENLWSWSPMYRLQRNIDPESIQQSDAILTSGAPSGNANNYPMLKSFAVGMSLTL